MGGAGSGRPVAGAIRPPRATGARRRARGDAAVTRARFRARRDHRQYETVMSASVRAAVMPGPGRPIEVRRFPDPRPAPGGAILETVASEVCGTDVHLHHGRLAGAPYPIIPGHVSVGLVLESNGVGQDALGEPL